MGGQIRNIINLAVPAIVSNITVPLLGLVDMTIVGHMGSTKYIGAVAIGSMMFSCIYWLFGFLRMSTSGLTAQALGRGDNTEGIFRQSATLALLIAAAILLLCVPIEKLCVFLMEPPADILPLVDTYFYICVWGAPAMLMQYALTGWFIGMQNTKAPMIVAIAQNVCNIALSLCFVYALDMKIEGVALGTLCSQWAAMLLAVRLKRQRPPQAQEASPQPPPKEGGDYKCPVNQIDRKANISSPLLRKGVVTGGRGGFGLRGSAFFLFLRTIFLMSVMFFFTAAGSRQGEAILAVNTLMMQTWLIFSYFMDGFAYAGEALAGKYYGAGDRLRLAKTVSGLFQVGAVVAVIFTLLYVFATTPFLSLLTDSETVVLAAQPYIVWIALVPFLGMAAFLWDGVFIGLTMAREMLWATMLGNILFFIIYYTLSPTLQNHALWLAFIVFLSVRGITQTILYHSKKPPSFPPSGGMEAPPSPQLPPPSSGEGV